MLQPKLRQLLRRAGELECGMTVHLDLKADKNGEVEFDSEKVKFSGATEQRAIGIDEHFKSLSYLGLRQYAERDVVVVKRRHCRLLVAIRSELFIEVKSPFLGVQTKQLRNYRIWKSCFETLLSAKGCPGVANVEGVVVDDNQERILSFLVAAPTQGPLDELMRREAACDRPVSWQRRERWLYQLFSAVSELHKRRIAGVFGASPLTQFWIDAYDNLHITDLKAEVFNWDTATGYHRETPPEIYHGSVVAAEKSASDFSYQTDVFFLGYFTWRLASYTPLRTENFCDGHDCNAWPRYRCTAEHTSTSVLPLINNDQIPSYVNELINQCRRELPDDRPPTSELLQLIPVATQLDESLFSVSEYSASENGLANATCDECCQIVGKVQYHCHSCYRDNFDLCSACVASGVTCFDIQHNLTRNIWENGEIVSTSIYMQAVLKESSTAPTEITLQIAPA